MKKILITIVATVLVCACVVGGTVAWLKVATNPVVNTFTIGNINITLTETAPDTDDNGTDEYDFKMVPGETLTKDPKVTVKAGSEACWVFIKLDTANNPNTYLDYSIDSAWTELTTGVWYVKQSAIATGGNDVELNVLENKQVTVKSTITKANIDALGTNKPSLTFTAYAIQQVGFDTAAAAWAEAQSATVTP